ncbi:hypothetical protein BDV24DRAFT_146314 [Aspergillus arachidicola]|uniref:Uncharacterized protein n=1 Tax=Aspergillus arachidicola TaxID=656916 RepID=A0A5N6XLV0_9EURO|nr:hypothetical protein BDV24DRAFT_146314 [Aspergillus arachidicola]
MTRSGWCSNSAPSTQIFRRVTSLPENNAAQYSLYYAGKCKASFTVSYFSSLFWAHPPRC